MKKLLLLSALLFSLSTQAQQLSIDANTGQTVAPVVSYAVSGLDSTYVTRIAFDIGSLSGGIVPVTWHLQYQYVKDSSNAYWYDDKAGNFTMPVIGDNTINESMFGIATFVQQHGILNNRRLKFTYR